MSVCTTETCSRVLGIYGDIVQGNTETLDTLSVEDSLNSGLLPNGARTGDPIAVSGSYTIIVDGNPEVIYEDGYLLKLN